jgi:hypothetical protein
MLRSGLQAFDLTSADSYQRLDDSQWLAPRYDLAAAGSRYLTRNVPGPALSHNLKHGRMDVAKWLVQTFDLTAGDARYHIQADIDNALHDSCERGCLDVSRWLVQTFDLRISDVRMALGKSLSHNKLEQWLTQMFGTGVSVPVVGTK